MTDPLRLLPQPTLTLPPDCACKGLAPQMREHTALFCSRLKTDEINALILAVDDWSERLGPVE